MRTQLLLTLAVAGPLSAVLALPAAAAPCDAYSGGCPTQGSDNFPGGNGAGNGAAGGGGTGVSGSGGVQDSNGGALPFTGGEIVLMSTLGLAAVGGGTVLVLAGRRRRDVTPA